MRRPGLKQETARVRQFSFSCRDAFFLPANARGARRPTLGLSSSGGIASRLFRAKIKCSICSSQFNTWDASDSLACLCINLIFGQRARCRGLLRPAHGLSWYCTTSRHGPPSHRGGITFDSSSFLSSSSFVTPATRRKGKKPVVPSRRSANSLAHRTHSRCSFFPCCRAATPGGDCASCPSNSLVPEDRPALGRRAGERKDSVLPGTRSRTRTKHTYLTGAFTVITSAVGPGRGLAIALWPS